MNNNTIKIDAAEIEIAIQLLNKYVDNAAIKPVILVLEALKKAPENEALIVELADALNSIGPTQGAVLTYAPYVSALISHGLFGDD